MKNAQLVSWFILGSALIQAKGYMHFANGWMFVIPLYYAAITSLSTGVS